jgi:hypothetical protein
MIAFEGMEPKLSELPPSQWRSISATVEPTALAARAAATPAGPAPTITRS